MKKFITRRLIFCLVLFGMIACDEPKTQQVEVLEIPLRKGSTVNVTYSVSGQHEF